MISTLYIGEGSGFAGAESYTLNLVRAISALDRTSIACALFYKGPLKHKLRDEGVRVFQLFGRNNFKSIAHLIRCIRDNHVEVVHLIDLKSTIIWGFTALFFRRIRSVATVHGIPESYDSFYMRIKHTIALTLYYLVLRFIVDGVICVSTDLASRLAAKVGRRKIRVIHNGLDLNSPAPSVHGNAVTKNKFIIGTVGRLDYVKGHSYFLESAAQVLAERNDVTFYIIGTGPLAEALKQRAELLGIVNRVRFWGFRNDVRTLTAFMDIFVLSSLHEGIPYALLEAMFLSKPVVCTDVGGIKEVIRDRVDGLLVPAKDSQALSQALITLLDNSDYAAELGRKARKRIEAQFSSNQMALKTYALYKHLTSDSPRVHTKTER
jgi:glycosyltransferase involved in cell wall biosynthesis